MFDERVAIGLPSLAGYDLSGALHKARDLGFQSVMSLPGGPAAEHSLGPFPTLAFYDSTEEQKRDITDALASFRHVAIHQAWDDQWARWIDCAAEVGAEVVTVHSGRPREGERSSGFLADRSEWLRRVGDYAAEAHLRVGVENEGGECDDYLELVESTDHPSVGATLDLGHCAYFHGVRAASDAAERVALINETIRTMVRALDRKLYSLHVHDVRQSDWRDHRCVGTGVIDFPTLFTELRRARYVGLMEIELEEPEKESAAIESGTYLTVLCQTVLGGTSPTASAT